MRRSTALLTACLYLWVPAAFAQIETQIGPAVPLEPFATARSPLFAIEVGDVLSVRPFGDIQLDIEISVYNSSQKLIVKEDPEEIRSRFEWVASESGTYYIVARNVSGVAGSFTVTIRRGAKAAGQSSLPYAAVRVFYASTRKPALNATLSPYYSDTEATKDVALGTVMVTIPRTHQTGELEAPAIYRLVDRENKSEFVLLSSVTPFTDRGKYFKLLSDQVRKTERQEALVFIHGFNVSFEDAARRTAQMSYDLGFGGAGIFFTWPSHHAIAPTPGEYNKAGVNAEASTAQLKSFLKDVRAQTGAKAIYLIAHSMGNRILTSALKEIGEEHGTERFREVALMAPDMSASLFRSLAASLRISADRITLYASSRDEALIVSEKLNREKRAGGSTPDVLTVPGIDTVDASSVRSDAFTFYHSYFADNIVMLSELYHVLRGDPPEIRFGLERVGAGEAMHWRFRTYSRR